MANPLIGSILKTFPAVRKTLRRNPGLADYVIQAFMSKATQPTQQTGDGHNHNTQVKFDL
jgi:hypothetical protein